MNTVKKSKVLIPLSLIAALIILAVSLSISVFASSKQDDYNSTKISNFDKQIKESQKKINEINDKKKETKDSLGLLMDEVSELEKQIDVFNQKINVLNSSIKELNSKIQISETQVKLQQDDIEKSKKELSERLRAMYIAGETSSIEILMSSDNFESFLTRVELVQRVSKHDKKLIDDLQSQVDKLKKEQKELNDKKAEIESSKKKLADAKNEISPKQRLVEYKAGQVSKQYNSLAAQGKVQESIQRNLERKKAAFEAQIDRETSGDMSSGSGSGILGVPYGTPGYYVSSNFGPRKPPIPGASDFHGGVDISRAGARNLQDTVIAAGDGVVIVSRFNAGGYGNYVKIDHGNGLSTVYGHMHRKYVTEGQRVKKGQTIGIVGSTGCSTGAHLHFEVRVNNKRVNPRKYVSLPPKR